MLPYLGVKSWLFLLLYMALYFIYLGKPKCTTYFAAVLYVYTSKVLLTNTVPIIELLMYFDKHMLFWLKLMIREQFFQKLTST